MSASNSSVFLRAFAVGFGANVVVGLLLRWLGFSSIGFFEAVGTLTLVSIKLLGGCLPGKWWNPHGPGAHLPVYWYAPAPAVNALVFASAACLYNDRVGGNILHFEYWQAVALYGVTLSALVGWLALGFLVRTRSRRAREDELRRSIL